MTGELVLHVPLRLDCSAIIRSSHVQYLRLNTGETAHFDRPQLLFDANVSRLARGHGKDDPLLFNISLVSTLQYGTGEDANSNVPITVVPKSTRWKGSHFGSPNRHPLGGASRTANW